MNRDEPDASSGKQHADAATRRDDSANGAALTYRLIPVLNWIRRYQRGWLRADLAAGCTLAAYMIPVALAYSSLAGLPPQAGLYSCMVAGIAFFLFCDSRQTAIAVTSAISLLLARSLGDMAGGSMERYTALAALTAIMVGMLAIVGSMVHAGQVVSFISDTVLAGFKAGVALQIAASQIPKLLGMRAGGDSFVERCIDVYTHIGDANMPSVAVGLGALLAILVGERLFRNRPVTLLVVLVSIVLAGVTRLSEHGVQVLGDIPRGLPTLQIPLCRLSDLDGLLPLVLACFLLATVETMAVSRTFSLKHGYRLNVKQEFLALGASNIVAGLAHGYPVSGGMSQSAVNESAGARSSISLLTASLAIGLVTAFCTGLFSNLPQPVLAAVVLAAVLSLIDLRGFARLARFSKGELLVALVAFGAVLMSGLLMGVLIGAIVSLMLMLRRGSSPHMAVLGRVPGTEYFADAERHPENETSPDVLIFRVDAPILYYNVEAIRDRLLELSRSAGPSLRLVIFCLATAPTIDLAGADILLSVHARLAARGVEMRLAEAHGEVRDCLRAAGLELSFGPIEANRTVADVLHEWKAEQASHHEPA